MPNSSSSKNCRLGLVGPLPPPFGGMANQTMQLSRLLAAEGLDVVLIQTNKPYPEKWFAQIKGVRAICRLIPYLVELWKQSKVVDCFHVMANSGWSWQLFAAPAIWIGWLRHVPVIVNYRGGEADQYFSASVRWVRPSMNRAKAIVVPSLFLQNVFERFGFASVVIPNIVDLDRFAFNGRLSIQDGNAPVIVVARNLEAIYGIEDAIKAMAILRTKIPAAKMYIAGEGPLRQTLLAMVEKDNLAANVEFVGKLTPDEMADLYAKSDIMLNPTTVDNMPNSILEAMAKGIAVISTNVGGIPFIVHDQQTALLVDVNRPDLLAEKIEYLVSDPDQYQRLVSNAHADVKKYAWDVVKTQWLNLYRHATNA